MGISLLQTSQVVKLINAALHQNQDASAIITGEKGVGKSTFSIQLAMGLLHENNMKWEVDKYLDIRRWAIIQKIKYGERFTPVINDEATSNLFKRDFMNREQNDLVKLLDRCRKLNRFLIFNYPQFTAMDNYARNGIKFWFYLPRRNYAFLMVRDKNPFINDPWHINYAQKLIPRFPTDLGSAYQKLRRLPTFVGLIKFERLHPQVENKYLRYVAELERELENENEKKLYNTKELSIYKSLNLLSESNLLKGNYKDWATILKIPRDRLNRGLKISRKKPVQIENEQKPSTLGNSMDSLNEVLENEAA